MNKIFSRHAFVVMAAIMATFLLASCAEDEPAETQASPTTGETDVFEIAGTVLEVDVEAVEATPSPDETATAEATPSPTGTASPTPSGPQQALILLEVDSIDTTTAELCDVSEGDSITLTVSEEADITPPRELDELDELADLSVRAEGTAEELAEEDADGAEESPTPEEDDDSAEESPTADAEATASPTGEPEAGCHYEVTALTEIEQGDQTPSPSGADGDDSEEGDDEGEEAEGTDDGSPAPGAADGGNGSPTPTQTASPSPTGGTDESPEASPTADD